MAGIIIGLLLALGPALLYLLDGIVQRRKKRVVQQARPVIPRIDLPSQTQPSPQIPTAPERQASLTQTPNLSQPTPPKFIQYLEELEAVAKKLPAQPAPPVKPTRNQLRLTAHKVATEEYYNGQYCPAFDYSQFATEYSSIEDMFMRTKVRSRATKNEWTVKTRFYTRPNRELKPVDFGVICKEHWLPEEELKPLVASCRRRLAIVGPYEALKLLLPHHIKHFFQLKPPGQFMGWDGRLRTSNMGYGPDWVMSLDGAYSRSYIARLIVFHGFDWAEIIQVAEFMFRKGMITMPAKYLQKELEALRWCAKYWYRALAFDEPINFDHDTDKWSRSKKRKSVSDYNVPPLLQIGLFDYSILSAHTEKPRASIRDLYRP